MKCHFEKPINEYGFTFSNCMCHLAVPGPDGHAKHFLRVGICPPTECPTACGIGKYSQCPDPTGQGGPWMLGLQQQKAAFRKMIQKAAPGERILICACCLRAGRRCVFYGWNYAQHVKAKKNIGCTRERNSMKLFSTSQHIIRVPSFLEILILKNLIQPAPRDLEKSYS